MADQSDTHGSDVTPPDPHPGVSAQPAFVAAVGTLILAAAIEAWFLIDLYVTMNRYAAEGGYCSSKDTMEAGQPGLILWTSLVLLGGGILAVALATGASRREGRRAFALGAGVIEIVASLVLLPVNFFGPFGAVVLCHVGG
jgi:hypothetical protein